MSVEIILSQVPLPHGNKSTFILRVDEPHSVTWNQIFDFCEEKSKLPRRFIKASNYDGKCIMGKFSNQENILTGHKSSSIFYGRDFLEDSEASSKKKYHTINHFPVVFDIVISSGI